MATLEWTGLLAVAACALAAPLARGGARCIFPNKRNKNAGGRAGKPPPYPAPVLFRWLENPLPRDFCPLPPRKVARYLRCCRSAIF